MESIIVKFVKSLYPLILAKLVRCLPKYSISTT